METLVDIDKSLFVFLNSLGSDGFDFIWLSITDKKSSIPLYLFLIYYIYKKFSNKEFLKYMILVIVLIALTAFGCAPLMPPKPRWNSTNTTRKF